jgi:hypothetical protein
MGKLGPAVVAPEVWITENWYERQIEVTEQSWTLDGYDTVLTLLVVIDVNDPQEEDMVGHYERKPRSSLAACRT